MPANIILIGFSGTGKTRVGREVAQTLGWLFIDTDEEIQQRQGKAIHQIFAQEGEGRFRELERQLAREACEGNGRVVSVGGGAFVDPENQQAMRSSGLVVCLEARPETIYQRLKGQEAGGSEGVIRPMLASGESLKRIQELKAQRQWAYALADWTVHTDALTEEQAAQEVVRAWRTVGDAGIGTGEEPELAAWVHAVSGSYPVYVGWGTLELQLGARIREMDIASTVYIISDEQVFSHHGRATQRSLQRAGIVFHSFIVPSGESSKSLETAQTIYQWLADLRAEPGHAVLALGGGVVGDLAGFVAASYLRGMPLIQVPTSLTAMVDASIGGKTGVNLPEGKNLVGVFHQPRLVLADVQLLTTMPDRELLEGWAEAIKHGLILDAELFHTFEERAEDLLALKEEVSTQTIRRSVALKAQVVSEDERETTGKRTLLNYGHTIGHGLEAASEYQGYLHGEAVAVGMMGAARIGHQQEITPGWVVERQEELLRRFHLPVAFQGVEVPAVLEAMTRDKKRDGGDIRWVLLEELGRAVVHPGVPAKVVEEVVSSLVQPHGGE